jgi:uncharacterized phage protein (TIGR02218 family)/uncharacterized protein (TIGR02217 family)
MNLYYHVFGTCREKSLNGSQDNPAFWRTLNPISWDKVPRLDIASVDDNRGTSTFGQQWKIVTKYKQIQGIGYISETNYNARETGAIDFGFGGGEIYRTSANYSSQGSISGHTRLGYDVEIVAVVRVTNPAHFPLNPYPVDLPEFPILPDKDFSVEIQFSNYEYDNTGDAEQRIVEWADPIRVFNLSRSALRTEDLDRLLDFHEARKGAKGDFLYRDLSDDRATRIPVNLGNGASTQGVLYPDADGTRTEFILTKAYSCGGSVHYRPILYPDAGLKIYRGNTELSGYVVAPDRIVFDSPPSAGLLTWEGTFKIPCSFESDRLDYRPLVKTIDGNPTTIKGVFEIPKFVLRESRIEPAIVPADVFEGSTSHVFGLNLYKASTLSPEFQTNIIDLSSGERKRFARRGKPSDTNSLQQRKTLRQRDIEYLTCLWLSHKGTGATFLFPDLLNGGNVISRFNSKSLSYSNQTIQRVYSLGELQIRRFTDGARTDAGTGGSLSSPVLTICRSVLIELADGEKLGYTNHSRDLRIDGVTYRARRALDPTALDRSLGFNSDNEEFRGAFTDDLKESLILSPRFQEAKIITAVVDWRDLPDSLLDLPDERVQIGFVGEIASKSGETYTLENLTEASIKLRQSRDERVTPLCRWFFGQDNGDGTGCRKSIPTYTSSVRTVTDRRVIEVYGVFDNLSWGTLTFLDGKNKSASYPIYRSESYPASSGTTRIELFTGASDSIFAHDKVRLTAGCDRTYGTCRTLWDNTGNFGGVPSSGNFMPGGKFLFASPTR